MISRTILQRNLGPKQRRVRFLYKLWSVSTQPWLRELESWNGCTSKYFRWSPRPKPDGSPNPSMDGPLVTGKLSSHLTVLERQWICCRMKLHFSMPSWVRARMIHKVSEMLLGMFCHGIDSFREPMSTMLCLFSAACAPGHGSPPKSQNQLSWGLSHHYWAMKKWAKEELQLYIQ